MDFQRRYPRLVAKIAGKRYWHYQDWFYWENEGLNPDQVYALITTREQRRVQQIERAQATVALGSHPRGSFSRTRIPDDVKQYVLTRDSGRCQGCGSADDIQYDHIIPVSKGGSSNVENLQILCGSCNRFKSDGLTTRR
ncbi:HNH endonuclease [Arthrobacter sp. zg-Y179]|uniref:HNH endonuclease n=1 Tax=Arthrobacter sp. zg-Y179 TaxID=2894188 RepID=UPI001E2F300D|nr:HNH endonuclease [Arthrobacter sp. zg-Y179]MCC9175467.1 HNH endonuclease [Arthrobacter sp. zg-Y179]